MKLLVVAALMAVVCYVALMDQVDAQAASTTVAPVTPPPKNHTCGKGGRKGKQRQGRSAGNDLGEQIKEKAKEIGDKAKAAVEEGVNAIKTQIKGARASVSAAAGSGPKPKVDAQVSTFSSVDA